MSEQQDFESPEVRTRSLPSIVWLVPLVTAIVGGWLILRTLTDQLPVATIQFKTAEGIEAGKTKIKYKSVDIGVVNEIAFADDFSNVIVTAEFNEGLDDFLRRNTRFWVVRPQLSVRGVSGLGTLISGAYIEIDPGPGATQTHFVGLEETPLITTDDAGRRITMISSDLGSLGRGSPIYYQGLLAGEILGYELAGDAKSVYIHGFIRDPFDQLVKGNSRFWNVSGLDVSMGADGFDVKTASVTSLLFGGVAFDTPDALEQSVANVSDLVFTLHQKLSDIENQAFARKVQFVMYFTGSVRGLKPGAPLEFRGIRIGQVLDIRMEFDADTTSFRIPVLVELEPDRIIHRDSENAMSPEQTLTTLVDKGLRGRLQTGSLLTGQLFIEFNMYPGADLNLVADESMPYPELPTIPGAFEAISQSLANVVEKIDTVDIETLGDNLENIFGAADKLVNKKVDEDAATDLEASIKGLRDVLANANEGNLNEAIQAARNVLVDLQTTVQLVNNVLDPHSPLQHNVIKVTDELEEMSRSIRALIETLERQPNSVIFGRKHGEEEQ
ncbi:MAG: MCE family protein [Pseudomonadales bacterium]|nr:MCE family protein [Pseudomonadales bacterium]MBO6596967.1 MCE family protein [Pseudomonadales bacterium]MBO6823847.1 MCE family protein [Pseudomonadales bacterium]